MEMVGKKNMLWGGVMVKQKWKKNKTNLQTFRSFLLFSPVDIYSWVDQSAQTPFLPSHQERKSGYLGSPSTVAE